jgi:hypothetical protein
MADRKARSGASGRGARRGGAPMKKSGGRRFLPVRRGQLISPFGVGAVTDFRNDEAMMCAGLDAWFNGQKPAERRPRMLVVLRMDR